MARADAWRLSGGIYLPNPTFIDTDYDWTASENLPDSYVKQINSGTCTTNLMDGFDGGRALRVANNSVGNNTIQGGRSPSGSVPQRAKTTALQVRLRVLFWYQKSSASQSLTPIVTIYNADESNSLATNFTAATAAAASWTKYEATALIDLNQVDLGFYPDHVRLTWQMGGAGVACLYKFARPMIGYQLTDIDGADGYDTLASFPLPSGLTYAPIQVGAYSRTHLGQMRRTDTTGGARPWRLQANFEIARDADAKLFSLARALNEGDYCPEDNGFAATRVAPSPIIVEPFIGDGATQSAGKIPENICAWMTEPPALEPNGYLGNVWRGTVGFEEVG